MIGAYTHGVEGFPHGCRHPNGLRGMCFGISSLFRLLKLDTASTVGTHILKVISNQEVQMRQ